MLLIVAATLSTAAAVSYSGLIGFVGLVAPHAVRLMWGNDYPHGDSVFPNSKQVLSEILSDCTPEERWKMTVKNVVELYDLPFELTGPDQANVNHLPVPKVKTWRNSLPLPEVSVSTPLK